MPYIKLLSELVAWRNFTLKEESPDRIVFELWDKANWERIAKGINRDNLVNSSIFIALIFGGFLFAALILSKSWGNLSFLISAVITILFIAYKVKLYQKTKFASSPCAVFDRNTGLATGVNIDFSTFESTRWQIEIAQIYSLALKWDDPRFDMAMLEALDSNGLILYVVFGKSNDLHKNAEILKKWLKVAFQNEIKS
jgi:hypothetical protein